jgi:hypothetical protein
MARRTTSRKLTRRDAVALLGAGTVIGAVRTAPAASRAVAQGDISCDTPAVVGTLGRGSRLGLFSYSCCEETKNALLVGVQEKNRKPTERGKAHLVGLQERLRYDNLEEYCFMLWGLNQEQAIQLAKTLPQQMGFEPAKRLQK